MTAGNSSPHLLVSESAHHAMSAAARRAHPNETGGILVGVHIDGQPWVTAAVELVTSDRGRNHYKIPSGVTQPAVLAQRQIDERVGYLGDWHSHPGNAGPSPTDLATLAFISIIHPRTPNPTLVVVRRNTNGYVLDARRIVATTPRNCHLRITGGLPPLTQPGTDRIDPTAS